MKKILILFIGISFLSFTVHKYYIALTEIEYNSENKSVEMIMNVFVDDIEKAINTDFGTDLQLNTKLEAKDADTHFKNYLKEHFKVILNDKPYTYDFLGKEYDGNIVYFYLEIKNISSVKSIAIENDVLIQHFSDQQNLIKAKINGARKSLFLTKKNDKGLLNF